MRLDTMKVQFSVMQNIPNLALSILANILVKELRIKIERKSIQTYFVAILSD